MWWSIKLSRIPFPVHLPNALNETHLQKYFGFFNLKIKKKILLLFVLNRGKDVREVFSFYYLITGIVSVKLFRRTSAFFSIMKYFSQRRFLSLCLGQKLYNRCSCLLCLPELTTHCLKSYP